MTGATMKELVKAARQAIANKEYVRAAELCDEGLSEDPKHYALLVFKALVLHHLNNDAESEQLYTKASTLDPDQVLAWQVTRIQ